MPIRPGRLTLALLIMLAVTFPAAAQSALTLTLHRNFGFAWGDQIQGNFTVRAAGPSDLAHVLFLIDGQPLGEAGGPPFETPLHTGDYAVGSHTLSAEAATSGGVHLSADPLRLEFVPADVASRFAVRLVVPVLALVAVGVLAAIVLPMLLGGGAFRPGSYGPAGGAVCPRCRLPFGRHVLSPNVVFGKFERCPHCGRMGIVTRATAEDLAAAEARLTSSSPAPPVSNEDQLRRQIDESRYEK